MMKPGFVVNTRSMKRRQTGVERYTAEVVKRLGDRVRCEAPGKHFPLGTGHLWEQLSLPLKVGKRDLLWSPANTGPLTVPNQVLTLHDTSVLDHPEWFQPLFAGWYRWMLPRLVKRVRKVLTVSENSRRRIVNLFSLPSHQVIAIPGGVDVGHFQPATAEAMERLRRRYDLRRDYLLFIGSIEPRKNLGHLLIAWKRIRTYFPDIELVLAGCPAPNFSRARIPGMQSPSKPVDNTGIRLLGFVPETDLPSLYSGAKVFALPSLTEGFGLTVLEAMACGTPVIASEAGALPETVDNAGVLVDPKDPDCLAEAILELLSNQKQWLAFQQHGLENVKRYPWEKTAERIWQELNSVSQGGWER